MLQILPIVIFFALIIFSSFISALARKLGGWNKSYQDVAKRFSGTVYPGYLFSRPSMTFNYGRTPCRVYSRKSKLFPLGKSTEMVLNWPQKNLKLEITTHPNPTRLWNRGAPTVPVLIEDRTLDGSLDVLSNQADLAATMVNPAVQWQIQQLFELLNNRQLSIRINRGKMTISKPSFIKNFEQLDDFVRLSLSVFDQLILTDCDGVEFKAENDVTIIENVTCPICTEPIDYITVVCIRCKTPHCLDCWEYNGQCATFGCNEKRYIRPDGQVVNGPTST